MKLCPTFPVSEGRTDRTGIWNMSEVSGGPVRPALSRCNQRRDGTGDGEDPAPTQQNFATAGALNRSRQELSCRGPFGTEVREENIFSSELADLGGLGFDLPLIGFSADEGGSWLRAAKTAGEGTGWEISLKKRPVPKRAMIGQGH